ncbi:MAG: hypothetical protein ACJAZ3_001033, partial [Sphingobacteriales bacterium]
KRCVWKKDTHPMAVISNGVQRREKSSFIYEKCIIKVIKLNNHEL